MKKITFFWRMVVFVVIIVALTLALAAYLSLRERDAGSKDSNLYRFSKDMSA
jgi:predicted MFS family arabinose efflux permease